VRTLGVMFLLFTPLPYVDATASWAFRNSWHRVFVGAAGMLVEFFLAAIGAMVWASTGPGLVNSIAFNVMVIGSVSSLIFNGNPLLRFDAYYMLSDAVEIPNLYQKAQKQWLYFGDRYLLGTQGLQSPAQDDREWWWLTAYGALSLPLHDGGDGRHLAVPARPVVHHRRAGTGDHAGHQAGDAAVEAVRPPHRPAVARNRQRALAGFGAVAAVVLLLVGWVPFPYAIQAQGILQAEESATVYAQVEGSLVEAVARNGQQVRPGRWWRGCAAPTWTRTYEVARQTLREVDAMVRQALVRAPGQLGQLQEQRVASARRLAELQIKREQLSVRSPRAGEWVAPALHEREGGWVQRGQPLGEVVQRSGFRFVAVVPQEQANELFARPPQSGAVRITGQSDVTLPVGTMQLLPYQQQKLLSPVLGWLGGGEIAVKSDDRSGNTAVESFFALYVALPKDLPRELTPLQGMSGQVRLELPGQPLFWQARRSLSQLLQKRYSV
jgi:putative peptide zinc metalloprotease protein